MTALTPGPSPAWRERGDPKGRGEGSREHNR